MTHPCHPMAAAIQAQIDEIDKIEYRRSDHLICRFHLLNAQRQLLTIAADDEAMAGHERALQEARHAG